MSKKDLVKWSRFYVDWTEEETRRIIGEQIAWLIDLMLWFIANPLLLAPKLSSQLLFYTHKFTVPENGSAAPSSEARALEKDIRPVFQAILVNMVPSEKLAILWVHKNKLEVFFPWPEEMASRKKAMDSVLDLLQTNWLRIPNLEIYTYRFLQGFHASNVWIPYFACLRLLVSMEEVQGFFLQQDLQNDLGARALNAYHHIGKNMGNCVALTQNPAMWHAFSPESPPIALSEAQIAQVATQALSPCHLPSREVEWIEDVRPFLLPTSATKIDERWQNFFPDDPKAPGPRFYF